MEIYCKNGYAKILNYYTFQYCPTDFNDRWYVKGFTELFCPLRQFNGSL